MRLLCGCDYYVAGFCESAMHGRFVFVARSCLDEGGKDQEPRNGKVGFLFLVLLIFYVVIILHYCMFYVNIYVITYFICERGLKYDSWIYF